MLRDGGFHTSSYSLRPHRRPGCFAVSFSRQKEFVMSLKDNEGAIFIALILILGFGIVIYRVIVGE